MTTYEEVVQSIAERSGERMFSDYMGGAMIPRGLDSRQAAIILQFAFPEDTAFRSLDDLTEELELATEREYKRIENEYYTPKRVYG
jgi:hypothetical protein